MKKLLLLALGVLSLLSVSAPVAAASAPVASLSVLSGKVTEIGVGQGLGYCGYNFKTPPSVVCYFWLKESNASTESLSWTAVADQGMAVTYEPSSGTLTPGKTVTLKVTTTCIHGYAAFIFPYTAAGLPSTAASVVYACT